MNVLVVGANGGSARRAVALLMAGGSASVRPTASRASMVELVEATASDPALDCADSRWPTLAIPARCLAAGPALRRRPGSRFEGEAHRHRRRRADRQSHGRGSAALVEVACRARQVPIAAARGRRTTRPIAAARSACRPAVMGGLAGARGASCRCWVTRSHEAVRETVRRAFSRALTALRAKERPSSVRGPRGRADRSVLAGNGWRQRRPTRRACVCRGTSTTAGGTTRCAGGSRWPDVFSQGCRAMVRPVRHRPGDRGGGCRARPFAAVSSRRRWL